MAPRMTKRTNLYGEVTVDTCTLAQGKRRVAIGGSKPCVQLLLHRIECTPQSGFLLNCCVEVSRDMPLRNDKRTLRAG